MLVVMTAVKNSVNDDVSVNAELNADFGNRKTMTSLKVMKMIETDLESNASSCEDTEYYSPKSVVVKKLPAAITMMMKEVNVSGRSRVVVHNPILRVRSEDSLIGEDIGEGFISKFDRDGGDAKIFSRPASPLGGKTIKSEH